MTRQKPSSQKDLYLLTSNDSFASLSKKATPEKKHKKSSFLKTTSSNNLMLNSLRSPENSRKLVISMTKESFSDGNREFLVVDEDFWCKTELLKRRLSL